MRSVPKPRCARGQDCYHVRKLRSEKPTTVPHAGDLCEKCRGEKTEPVEHQLASEEHMELFRAARVLFQGGITDEDVIIPTLVFAAQCQKRPLLRHIRDLFAKTKEGSKVRQDLENRFVTSLETLGSESVKDDVLFLRARPLTVLAYGPGPGHPVERITIDIYARSLRAVDPKDVEAHYEWALTEYAVPQSPYGLGLDEVWYPDRVRIMVSPPNPRIYAPGANFVADRSGGQQEAFPPPSRVRGHYASALGYARENNLTDILGHKRPGLPNRAYNLIPACVARYLGNCDTHSEQPDVTPETRKLVEEYFAALPDPPPIKTRSSLQRDVKRISLPVRRIDAELRNEMNSANLVSSFGQGDEWEGEPYVITFS
jgi:hypothetical protein